MTGRFLFRKVQRWRRARTMMMQLQTAQLQVCASYQIACNNIVLLWVCANQHARLADASFCEQGWRQRLAACASLMQELRWPVRRQVRLAACEAHLPTMNWFCSSGLHMEIFTMSKAPCHLYLHEVSPENFLLNGTQPLHAEHDSTALQTLMYVRNDLLTYTLTTRITI